MKRAEKESAMKAINEVVKKTVRPVKAVQFGEGNFLRAFIDYQIDVMNEKADFNGSVVMVQPLPHGMGDMINAQDGIYTTILSGVENGEKVEEDRVITSVDSCINPYTDYEKYIALADIPTLRFVFSNTTEAGIAYDPTVKAEDKPQMSFPGKVTAFLYRRYKTFNGDRSKGLIFIPCELIDKNGQFLRKYVLKHAEEWKLQEDFVKWIDESCDFCCSLVDRIVPGYPRATADEFCEKFGYKDNLLDCAEKFLFWAIEYTHRSHEDELPTGKAGLNVVWTDDMTFYRTRKVRILNGTHTMTVLAAYLTGKNTIEECMNDSLVSSFMDQGLFKEIIPSMDGDKTLLEGYAGDVLNRFRNPCVVHMLMSISLNSTSKFKTRDLPSLLGYVKKFGKLPKTLVFSLAALIAFYEGKKKEDGGYYGVRDGVEYQIKDTDAVDFFAEIYSRSYKNTAEKASVLTSEVLGKAEWWGQDLREVEGLEALVREDLEKIWTVGMTEAMKTVVE